MVGDNEKVRILTCPMTKELYDKFIQKISAEGWTVQQAIARLVLAYVNEADDEDF